MKAYKLVLVYIDLYDKKNKTIRNPIRYFTNQNNAEQISLEVMQFLDERGYDTIFTERKCLQAYLNWEEYKKKHPNFDQAEKTKITNNINYEGIIDDYIEFASTWPENTRHSLLQFLAGRVRFASVEEIENIEEIEGIKLE